MNWVNRESQKNPKKNQENDNLFPISSGKEKETARFSNKKLELFIKNSNENSNEKSKKNSSEIEISNKNSNKNKNSNENTEENENTYKNSNENTNGNTNKNPIENTNKNSNENPENSEGKSEKHHNRIYSMYNFQRNDTTLEPSAHEKKLEIIEKTDKSTVNCLICFDKSPDSVFMDCGHGGFSYIFIIILKKFVGICYDCALDVWKTTGECYLCRKVLYFLKGIILFY